MQPNDYYTAICYLLKFYPFTRFFVNENLSMERPSRKGHPIVIVWLSLFGDFLPYNDLLKMTCYTARLQFLKVVILTIYN